MIGMSKYISEEFMNITYDYYRIFYFVAKYQSFTKAASILLSNEPNISQFNPQSGA